jgi:predicted GIY-YIG superfamily endonuclease
LTVRSVYLLQSLSHPGQRYIGSTDDLRRRLIDHNSGASIHTAKYHPWRVVLAVVFQDDHRAIEFERYLKSGSGAEFARRHFW